MPDTSVPQLARKIYLEHREAIDLISSHKPDWKAEAKQWLREAVAQQPEWKLDVEDTKLKSEASGSRLHRQSNESNPAT